jgi:phage host-nuclease inhibitor protein Gam
MDFSVPHPDLLSSTTQRLQQLEQLNKALKSEATLKAKQISDLEKENQILKLAVSHDSDRHLQEEIEQHDKLKNQIKEMKKFLADYGLVWVGKDG